MGVSGPRSIRKALRVGSRSVHKGENTGKTGPVILIRLPAVSSMIFVAVYWTTGRESE